MKAESSDDPNALLYTIYEIEPTATYKGTEKETRKIKVAGGICGAYENEQIQAFEDAGAFDGTIPVCPETAGGLSTPRSPCEIVMRPPRRGTALKSECVHSYRYFSAASELMQKLFISKSLSCAE